MFLPPLSISDKLEAIDQQRKKAAHDVENLENGTKAWTSVCGTSCTRILTSDRPIVLFWIVRVEKRREAEELERMRKKNAALDREALDLPSKVETHKAQTDKQESNTSKRREVVFKKEREAKAAVEVERVELEVYKDALGMTIHKSGEDQLSFRFCCIDEYNPTAEFSFTIRGTSAAGSLGTVALVSCVPPLESVASFIESYNFSQREDKLSTLVRLVRREFFNSLPANRRD